MDSALYRSRVQWIDRIKVGWIIVIVACLLLTRLDDGIPRNFTILIIVVSILLCLALLVLYCIIKYSIAMQKIDHWLIEFSKMEPGSSVTYIEHRWWMRGLFCSEIENRNISCKIEEVGIFCLRIHKPNPDAKEVQSPNYG